MSRQIWTGLTLHLGTAVVVVVRATAGAEAYLSGRGCLFVPEVGIFTGALLSPVLVLVGNWKRLIPVPWKEVREVVELWRGGSRSSVAFFQKNWVFFSLCSENALANGKASLGFTSVSIVQVGAIESHRDEGLEV